MSRRPSSRADFHFAVICALPLEYDAVYDSLDEVWTDKDYEKAGGDPNRYATGCMGELPVVLLLLPGMGKVEAASAAASLRSSYQNLSLALVVGVCGAIPYLADGTEVILGDVIISKYIVRYDFGRQHSNEFTLKTAIEDTLGRPNKETRILSALLDTSSGRDKLEDDAQVFLQQLQDKIRKTKYQGKYDYVGIWHDRLFRPNYRHKHYGAEAEACNICAACCNDTDPVCESALELKCANLGCSDDSLVTRTRLRKRRLSVQTDNREGPALAIHTGGVGTADTVMKSGNLRDKISKRDKIIAFEMEGAGVWDELPSCIVIKGVCDYADSHKPKGWQKYAAATAASTAKAVLTTFFINGRARIQKQGLESDIVNRLPHASNALFNSYVKQHELTCLPDTRVDLLQLIYDWADTNDDKSIFWLNGLAGTGKSTIARTVARRYFDNERLGASFFFSKGGGDVGHARKFCTTIALQLANNIPSLQRHVYNAAAKHQDISNLSLYDQWHQLILNPLSDLREGEVPFRSYVVVIDALDECDNDNNVRIIVDLLATAQSLKTLKLRIFLTSRPETPIRNGFYQIPDTTRRNFVLHHISTPIIHHDIYVFIKYHLSMLREELSLHISWPGEQLLRQLVQNASGLFIWAATACRFIRDGKRFAPKRLDIILAGSNSSTTVPEKHLDEIYVTILRRCILLEYTEGEKEEVYSTLKQVLGTTAGLFSPLSVLSLSRFLHVDKEAIIQTLDDLHAIVDIPKDETQALRLHHPSFRDFLFDRERCHDSKFWMDENMLHQELVSSCLRLMCTSLKQDICQLDDAGVNATDIQSNRVDKYIPSELRYACLYWVDHLQRCESQLYDDCSAHRFLQQHLLHWIEALSWIGQASHGIRALVALESIAKSNDSPNIYALVHDARRAIHSNRSAIDEAPLQLYLSTILFAPRKSLVRQHYRHELLRWIKRCPDMTQMEWGSLMQTLEHTNAVSAVAFSPNGELLATASYDNMVKLWDVVTGAILKTFNNHTDSARAITFSPNSKLIASASDDATVQLCNITTNSVCSLRGHANSVSTVTFSPDGRILASGSSDKTVCLWDTTKGDLAKTLRGHTESISAIRFSPDGKLVISASGDNTILVWDIKTGVAITTLKGHSGYVWAVDVSPDGELIATGSYDSTVRLWDTATGITVQKLTGHSFCIRAVAFSPGGTLVASASIDNTVRLWDVATGVATRLLESHSDCIAFSPDGMVIATALQDNTICLWDTATGGATQTLQGHQNNISAIVFSPDGGLVASGSFDKTVRLWKVATDTNMQTTQFHTDSVKNLSFSPDGKLVASSLSQTVQIWNSTTDTIVQTLKASSSGVMAFSPDNKLFVTSSGTLWDVATGTGWALSRTLRSDVRSRGKAFSTPLEGPWHTRDQFFPSWLEFGQPEWGAHDQKVAFSADSKLVATASEDGQVELWDVVVANHTSINSTVDSTASKPIELLWDGANRHTKINSTVAATVSERIEPVPRVRLWDNTADTHTHTVDDDAEPNGSITFLLDGKLVTHTLGENTVLRWHSAMGSPAISDCTATAKVTAFSTDGRLAISDSHTIKLWNAMTDAVWLLDGHTKPITAVAFAPNGNLLASGSRDDTVRIWDATTGTCTLKLTLTFSSIDNWISSVAFSPDSTLVASGLTHTTGEKAVCLWNVMTGAAIQTLRNQSPDHWTRHDAKRIAFSPDGKLIAALIDSSAQLWSIATGTPTRIIKGLSHFVFSPDSTLIASAGYLSNNQNIELCNIATGTTAHPHIISANSNQPAVLSPNSKIVASILRHDIIVLWDMATGNVTMTLKDREGSIRVAATSQDGKLAATASDNNTVRLWDVATGTILHTIKKCFCFGLAFSRHGLRLTTNRGFVMIDVDNLLAAKTRNKKHLYIKDNWVTDGDKRLLWLPLEYRPSSSAFKNNLVALGLPSGIVRVIEFNSLEDRRPISSFAT